MEEKIKIINSNHNIHWKLNSKQKSNKLIIFVHGLWGNINEHMFFNWYKFFNDQWFDTFRLDLYYQIGLTDNTILNQSKDLEATINYFKDRYNEIYLVWHSLWWPIILLADTNLVKKIILRDPVLDTHQTLRWELKETNNFHYVSWWMDIIIWEKMKDEFQSIWDINNKLDDRFSIIYASNKWLSTEFTRTDIKYCFIKNSDHSFHNDWNEQELFETTLNLIH
jgi:pimeloyl-ACP methyl ester carboxylesterase